VLSVFGKLAERWGEQGGTVLVPELNDRLVQPQPDENGYDRHGSTRNDTEKSILWQLFFRVFPCASIAIKQICCPA